MNFTREPIIETIISPKEGFKLLIRNTKGGSSEYSVDAIEVVNFGNALFFRSLERPKAFLLPITDFEVVETKESRIAIKSAQVERSVQIASNNSHKSEKKEDKSTGEPEKKKRRSRRRRSTEDRPAEGPAKSASKGGDKVDEASQPSSPRTTSLFAPPPSLISGKGKETISSEENLSKEKPLGPPDQKEPLIKHLPLSEGEEPGSTPDDACALEPREELKIPSKDK